MRWKESLRKQERNWGGAPGDLHDGHKPGLDGSAHLVEGAGASDNGHTGEINGVLDGRDLSERIG